MTKIWKKCIRCMKGNRKFCSGVARLVKMTVRSVQAKKDNHSTHSSASKRKRPDPNEGKQDAVKGIVDKLREKFGNKNTPEQYHAWAQLIQLGKHSSYDEAPDYPFFADSKKNSSNKTSDVDETCSAGPSASTKSTSMGFSPGKRLTMRTEYLRSGTLSLAYQRNCMTSFKQQLRMR